MVQRDKIKIFGREMFRSYSDQGYYITLDNKVFYRIAYDPITTIRLYHETDRKIN